MPERASECWVRKHLSQLMAALAGLGNWERIIWNLKFPLTDGSISYTYLTGSVLEGWRAFL